MALILSNHLWLSSDIIICFYCRKMKNGNRSERQYQKEEKQSQASSQQRIQNIALFDQDKIIEHYRRVRQRQHQNLATINMNQEMKRKLFGFSEGYYLTNRTDPSNLVIEDHPLKGKIIQSSEKYQHYLIQKSKEKHIRSNHNNSSVNSSSSAFSLNRDQLGSEFKLNVKDIFPELPNQSYARSVKNVSNRKTIK